MTILINALLFLLGLLAAQAWVTSKFGGARALVDKLLPLQRYLGIAGLVVGIFLTIDALKALSFLGFAPMRVLLTVATCILLLLLGLLLGYDLLQQTVLSKNEAAARGGAGLRNKLAGIQIQLGLLAMAVAVLGLLTYLASPL